MDDSPHTRQVLSELVDAGYVHRCSSLAAATAYLNGQHPVITKGALTSKQKDGIWKHRLILDCRVSGANSATHKWERILLPKAWDVVRGTMRLKKLATATQEGRTLSYFVCDVKDAFHKLPPAL